MKFEAALCRRAGIFRKTEGVTVIELVTVTALIGSLAAVSMTVYRNYDRAAVHRASVRETVAVLRNAQVRAVSESSTHECRFRDTTLTIYDSAGKQTRTYSLPPNLRYVSSGTSHGVVHGFVHSGTNANSNCYLYAGGTASGGTVGIRRNDISAEYDISLEPLTSGVSYCADPTPVDPC